MVKSFGQSNSWDKRFNSTMRLTRKSRARPAFDGVTLLELVVTLALVSLLAALLLPAIQAARESARRAQCTSQLRQIGLALQAYMDVWKALPPSYAFGGGSFYVPLLPHMEQEPLYEDILRQVRAAPPSFIVPFETFHVTTPPLVHCPSTWQLNRLEVHYAGNQGTGQPWFRYEGLFGVFGIPPPSRASDAMFTWALRPSARPSDMKDGLSGTAMLCEVIPKSGGRRPGKPVLASPRLFRGSDSLEEFIHVCEGLTSSNAEKLADVHVYWMVSNSEGPYYNHLLPPNRNTCHPGRNPSGSYGPATILTAGSYHPNGVNVLYADGRVAFVSDQIERSVWYALGTRQGRD